MAHTFPLSSKFVFVAWWIFHSPTTAPRSRQQKQKYVRVQKRSRALFFIPGARGSFPIPQPNAHNWGFLLPMHSFCALRVRDLHVKRVNKESGLTRSIPSHRSGGRERASKRTIEREQKVRNLALSRSIVNGLCKWKGHLLVSHTPNTLRRTQFVPPPLALLFCYLFSGAANKCERASERAAHPLRKLLQGARPSRAIPVHVMARVISAHSDIWHLECVCLPTQNRDIIHCYKPLSTEWLNDGNIKLCFWQYKVSTGC